MRAPWPVVLAVLVALPAGAAVIRNPAAPPEPGAESGGQRTVTGRQPEICTAPLALFGWLPFLPDAGAPCGLGLAADSFQRTAAALGLAFTRLSERAAHRPVPRRPVRPLLRHDDHRHADKPR